CSNRGRALGQTVGFHRVVSILTYRAGELFHARGRFLQGSGLLLRTAAQISVARIDFARTHVDLFHALAHHAHGTGQAVLHAARRGMPYADLVAGIDLHTVGQVATGDPVKVTAGLDQLAHHRTAEDQADTNHQNKADEDGNGHGGDRTVQGSLRTGKEFRADFRLLVVEGIHRPLEGLCSRNAKLVVHEVERHVVVAFERLHHGIDAVVDIRLVGADDARGFAALLAHVRHGFTELTERIADVAELLLGVVQRFTRALAQFRAVVAGRFL